METPLTELTDILPRAHGGDPAAFGRLVNRYRDMAVGYAMSLLGDEASAEDAVQEALVVAYQNLGNLRQPDAFDSWLRGIVRHRCGHARRRNARLVSLEGLADVSASSIRESTVEVAAAVASLPPRLREVVQLGYESGLTQTEIASRLGLSQATVNMRIHAARTRLRRKLMTPTKTIGHVEETFGPVVTVRFAPTVLPAIFGKLTSQSGDELCVVQILGTDRVKALALRRTALWTPGMEITCSGEPFLGAIPTEIVGAVVSALRSSSTDEAIPSGIRAVEQFAPLARNGNLGIFAEWGVGTLVLIPELLFNLRRVSESQTVFVFLPRLRDAAHRQEVAAEITYGDRSVSIVYLPVDDPLALPGLKGLDAEIVLSRRLAEQGIWPCIDPLSSQSRLAKGDQREKIRNLTRDYYVLQFGEERRSLKPEEIDLVRRGRQVVRMIAQPFMVAEPYTKVPGVYVEAETAWAEFGGLLE